LLEIRMGDLEQDGAVTLDDDWSRHDRANLIPGPDGIPSRTVHVRS